MAGEENQLSGVSKLVGTLMRPIVSGLTPILRQRLEDFLLDWREIAAETPSPYDDMAADFVLDMFNVPTR